jgi:hypothetical protein
MTKIFFTPLLCCCFWIRDGKKSGCGIRDKHPGSATQSSTSKHDISEFFYFCGSFLPSYPDSGYRSTDLIESGFNPGSKHWILFIPWLFCMVHGLYFKGRFLLFQKVFSQPGNNGANTVVYLKVSTSMV